MDQMETYKKVLARFCHVNGQVAALCAKGEGETPDPVQVKELLHSLAEYKKELLEVKEALGLDGGLSFMEDNGFLGFSVEQGRFLGNKRLVKGIVHPWISGFPENGNHFLYETANYVYFLAFPDPPEEPVEEGGEPHVPEPEEAPCPDSSMETEEAQEGELPVDKKKNKKERPSIWKRIRHLFTRSLSSGQEAPADIS